MTSDKDIELPKEMAEEYVRKGFEIAHNNENFKVVKVERLDE
jgi:hypothetical protein